MDIAKCDACGRERTDEDTVDYHPVQVLLGKPLGWYSGEDGEICPEDMKKLLSGQR